MWDFLEITDNIIDEVDEDEDLDLSPIKGWKIKVEREGDHDRDSQDCDYTVIFLFPDGIEYYLYDRHSLMTGWNFFGYVMPE